MYDTFLITVLAELEYTLAIKFDLKSVKRVLVKIDLNLGSLFISRLAESECLLVIKSELESVLVESESELCNGDNNTSPIYLGVRLTLERQTCSLVFLYTPTLSGKTVCGDLLTCIPLFIESIFEVPLKKKKKRKRRKVKKKKREARG
jgi:hypothetical protein